MKEFFWRMIWNSLIVAVVVFILPGLYLQGWSAFVLAGLILSFFNAAVRYVTCSIFEDPNYRAFLVVALILNTAGFAVMASGVRNFCVSGLFPPVFGICLVSIASAAIGMMEI
ncbi:MAG: phage holin family protein [Bacillota bacterium]